MGWVLFEVMLALGVAIFIVWWTLPKKRKAAKVAAADKTAAGSVETAQIGERADKDQ